MIPPDDILETEDVARQRMDAEAQAAAQQQVDPTMEARKEIAAGNDQTRLQIATMQREIKVMELAQAQNMTIAEVQADLEKMRLKLESDERTKAVEIAVEDRRAERAIAAGQQATEATGKGVG